MISSNYDDCGICSRFLVLGQAPTTPTTYMMLDKHNITAVILAGGKGRRLEGQDKGLVVYQEKTLIQHVIDRIQGQVADIVINANRNHQTYKELGYPVISDTMSNYQGPLAGVSVAMKSVKTDYILTLPCDAPLLPLNFVARMLNKLRTIKTQHNCIAVAHDGSQAQFIHALIPVALIDKLDAFLSTDERAVKNFYSQQDIIFVDFSDRPRAFFNINSAEQLLELYSVD